MKKISDSDGYMSKIERYMIDTPAGTSSYIGLAICYAVAMLDTYRLKVIELHGTPRKGEDTGWRRSYNNRLLTTSFGTIDAFINNYSHGTTERFTAFIVHTGVDVVINGWPGSAEICVSYPKEKAMDVRPLVKLIESKVSEMFTGNSPLTIEKLTEIMQEYGITIRAIPKTTRGIYEPIHKDEFPDGRLEYVEGYDREMLVVDLVPEHAGKFMIESVRSICSTVLFANRYFDSIEEAVQAFLDGKVTSPLYAEPHRPNEGRKVNG